MPAQIESILQITAQLNKEILTFQTEIGFYEKPKSFSLQGTTEQKAKPGRLKYQLFSIREKRNVIRTSEHSNQSILLISAAGKQDTKQVEEQRK